MIAEKGSLGFFVTFILMGAITLVVVHPSVGDVDSAMTIPIKGMTQSDSHALALVAVINQAEVQAADLALQKNVSSRVAGFAKKMKLDHEKSLTAVERLDARVIDINYDDSGARSLREQQSQVLSGITNKQGIEFERDYMDLMVTTHEEALKMIDSQLIPGLTQASVKNYVIVTKAHVRTHLSEAKKIRASL